MQPWKTLSRETILDHSKYLKVENHSVELPNGRVIADWPWVITPNYINVIAITTEKQFVCFRQTKYSIESTSLAPVGGFLEPNEEPLTAAKRELQEETGYEAPNWIVLGNYAVDGNRGVATAYFFLATEAKFVGKGVSDDLEAQELLLLSHDEVKTALLAGEFKVLPWAALVALALQYLER